MPLAHAVNTRTGKSYIRILGDIAMENISTQIQYEITTRKNLSFFREQFYYAEFIEADSLLSKNSYIF
jgi:hypothetical protein